MLEVGNHSFIACEPQPWRNHL